MSSSQLKFIRGEKRFSVNQKSLRQMFSAQKYILIWTREEENVYFKAIPLKKDT